jgi:hypothetical protein
MNNVMDYPVRPAMALMQRAAGGLGRLKKIYSLS